MDAEWTETVVTAGSTLGKEPPERKEGHSERSSGSEAGCLPMKDKIAAACEKKKKGGRTSSNWTCWCLLNTNLDASRH